MINIAFEFLKITDKKARSWERVPQAEGVREESIRIKLTLNNFNSKTMRYSSQYSQSVMRHA